MKTRAGLTLLEILISIGMFLLLLLVVTETVLSHIQAWGSARVRQAASVGSIATIQRLEEEIRLAESVVTSSSQFGTSTGRLTLVSFVSPTSTATTTVSIALTNGTVELSRGVRAVALNTSSSLRVLSLAFTHFSATTSQAVRIEMGTTASRGRFTATSSLATMVVLRGAY